MNARDVTIWIAVVLQLVQIGIVIWLLWKINFRADKKVLDEDTDGNANNVFDLFKD